MEPFFRYGVTNRADALINLLCDKRASYGSHNLTRFGPFGIVVRMSDKVERLNIMTRQLHSFDIPPESFEGIEDAFIDLAGYALAALFEIDKARGMFDAGVQTHEPDESATRFGSHG